MKIQRLVEPLIPISLVAGMTLVAWESASLIRLASGLNGWASAGLALLLIGSTTGFLGYTMYRNRAMALADEAREAVKRGKRIFLNPPENSMGELVRAINDSVSLAQRQVEQAAGDVKELQVQLKVADRQRAQAETIIHTINDSVMVTDRFDEVLLANDAAARMLGTDVSHLERLPVEQVFEDPAIVNAIRNIRQNNSANERRDMEYRRRAGNGREQVFKVTMTGIKQDSGEAAGVVSVFHDMTRENEIARMKNDFVSSVSHELRTPLASIRAYIEMLVDGEAEDEKTRQDFYEIIQNEANRLGRLIDNILSISRIESGLVEIKREPVSVMVIVKEAIEVVCSTAKLKNISVEEQLEPSMHQVNADREMLYQAVMNLLSNAVKYTPEGGKVTVRATVDEIGKKVAVRVIDTGVGIPAKDLPFVFDKFFRVEKNKSVAKGTGLGLSLVKNIIETVHRGRMFVESEEGRGSCFGFELETC